MHSCKLLAMMSKLQNSLRKANPKQPLTLWMQVADNEAKAFFLTLPIKHAERGISLFQRKKYRSYDNINLLSRNWGLVKTLTESQRSFDAERLLVSAKCKSC